MNKELEALKIGIAKLKKLYENSAKKMSQNDILGFDLVFVYLDKALHRLETIDNAKPSEALEWLEKFKGIELSSLPFKDDCGAKEVDLNEVRFVGSPLNNDFRKFVNTIEQSLIKAQEQEKVLNIIFEKKVDIYVLKVASSVEHYNNTQDLEKLTQEEFNTLKDMIK